MVKVAIIHHGDYGYTKAIAEHIAHGAKEIAMAVELYQSSEIEKNLSALEEADAIIFGSPTYFGSVSAEFKSFMDSTSQLWLKQTWKDKVAAAFTCANSPSGDQMSTLMQLFVFASQHSMIWAGSDLMPKMKEYNEGLEVYNKLGSWVGFGLAVRGEQGERIELEEIDIKAAKHFGKRIAKVAKKLK
ncbi:NADPH-dependent FMN reductase [endosymbiont of Acanthamoeba sp. UWC8]|uniref:flavodoxin family protein n=1 Tax=endosymbiont of Acanthamoeba sp. UWC8 TaxID=86106 RepID=UPI0004D1878A|nr:flavodoxin family protein [endosymbiont of Acanthamoeba sp. UWC8]AIF81884.1 NADPH-dependent FMN reductase [endosymbiont of Acanthamoeba sp. UWC8]